MKLAEALAERKSCQLRIEELRKRIQRSVRVQEGEQAPEDANQLLREVDTTYSRLLYLIAGINRTNARTAFDAKRTVPDAIAERELTGKRRDLLAGVAEAASTRQDRYSKSEVKFVATVSVAALQKQVDQLSREYRELDTRLQELNWKTEFIEG